MTLYSIIIFGIYFGLLIYIIPSSSLGFDLYERNFRLLPSWFKLLALLWLVIGLSGILIFKESIQKQNEVVFSVINLSLFISFFSKQKNEDEFSEQVRFKAITYSFVSFVAMVFALGVSRIPNSDDGEWSNFIVQGFMGAALFIATLYFYFTLYKMRKENN